MSIHPEANYERLERLYQQSPDLPRRSEFRQFVKAVWSALRESFPGASQQPKVRKFFDIHGLPIWYVYDPVTKKSFTAKSEFEMLNWLEGH